MQNVLAGTIGKFAQVEKKKNSYIQNTGLKTGQLPRLKLWLGCVFTKIKVTSTIIYALLATVVHQPDEL